MFTDRKERTCPEVRKSKDIHLIGQEHHKSRTAANGLLNTLTHIARIQVNWIQLYSDPTIRHTISSQWDGRML